MFNFIVKRFQIEHILEDHVIVNTLFQKLYGLKLESHSEVYRHLSNQRVQNVMSTGRASGSDNLLFIVCHRYRVDNPKVSNAYRTDVYYFSPSSKLLKVISDGYSNMRAMSGVDIANALISIHTVSPRWSGIEISTKTPLLRHPMVEEELYNPAPYMVYPSMVLNMMYGHDYVVYGNSKFNNATPAVIADGVGELLQGAVAWEGVIWMVFIFNDAKPLLEAKLASQRFWNDRYSAWKTVLDEYKTGALHIAPVAFYFVQRDVEDHEATAQSVFERLGFQCVRKRAAEYNLLLGTPFKAIDPADLYFLDHERIASYLPTSYQKTTILKDKYRDEVDLVGTTVNNDLVFYTLWADNPAQHSFIVAPTGSGKTFFLLNALSEMLGIDIKSLYQGNGSDAHIAPPKFKIRFFDVGLSGEFFVRLMGERGYDVSIVRPEISRIRYNVCEVTGDDPDSLATDIMFSLGIINMIMETRSQDDVLTTIEESLLSQALREIHANRSKHVKRPRLKEIQELFPDIYERLRAEGVEDYQELLYEHVKGTPIEQPRIEDVIVLLKHAKNRPDTTADMQAHYDSLIAKLSYIAEVENFAQWTSVNITRSDFLYIDLALLKQARDEIFEPLVMAILKRLVYMDSRYEDVGTPKIYIIEEAHNLLSRASFAKLFDTFTREARKYRIYLVYVSQNAEDIPDDILKNIQTKFILSPPDRDEVQAIIRAFNMRDEERRLFERLPRYNSMVMYSSGVFTFKLPVDEAKLKVFDASATTLETPDGIVIRKGIGVVKRPTSGGTHDGKKTA